VCIGLAVGDVWTCTAAAYLTRLLVLLDGMEWRCCCPAPEAHQLHQEVHPSQLQGWEPPRRTHLLQALLPGACWARWEVHARQEPRRLGLYLFQSDQL
jgi:hypothetical protein